MQWSGNIYGFLRHSESNSLKKEKFHGFLKVVPYLDVKSNCFLPKSMSHTEIIQIKKEFRAKNFKIAHTFVSFTCN